MMFVICPRNSDLTSADKPAERVGHRQENSHKPTEKGSIGYMDRQINCVPPQTATKLSV